MKNAQFEEEKETTKLDVTANSYSLREAVIVKISTSKKRPNLHWHSGKVAVRARLS